MNKAERQSDIVKRQKKSARNEAVKLGVAIGQLVEQRITPQQARFGLVAGLWKKLLPDELLQHSKISDISGSKMKVVVDSPLYKYELQLCSSELLNQLQQQCPQARIREIQFVVG